MKATILLVILCYFALISASKLPTPSCKSASLFEAKPLSPGQIQDYDLSKIFFGYNLNIALTSGSKVASVTPKFLELDRKKYEQKIILSYQNQVEGNIWEKGSYFLYTLKNSSKIYFAFSAEKANQKVPEFDFTVLITKNPNVTCFNAVLLMQDNLAIIDCIQKHDSHLKSYFYYVDLIRKRTIGKFFNQEQKNFTKINKRKLLKLRDPQSKNYYLARAYEAQGVDQEHRFNTFIQIFSTKNPRKLQLTKIIDNNFIGEKALSIVDVQVYMNNLFFLDSLTGLYRIQIIDGQARLKGSYKIEEFYKFSVYSRNIGEKLTVALANSQIVYEVYWSNNQDPQVINKYSLMENTNVKEVFLNYQYLFVQGSAEVDDGQINYTWIFTKGSRTYSNVYHIINHEGNSVQIQLDRLNDRLLIADSKGLALYQLDEARLKLQTDESKIGKTEEVILFAESTDPHTKETQKCQEKFTVYAIQATNQTIFSTKYPINSFQMNYPGQLHIGMNLYVQGPNITYDITNASHTPTYWINKRNKTNIHLPHDLNSVRFFHSQVIPEIGFENIIYFVEQYSKLFHIFECRHIWESADVFCREESEFNNPDVLQAFTTAYFTDKRGYKYFYVFVFKNTPNVVRVFDYEKGHKLIALITYDNAYDFVTEVASSNGYLYVLRSFKKTIDVYSLKKCQELEQCHIEFQIDAETLKSQIEYFSPQKIVTDFMHPEVLFIQCLGSILILDVDNHEKVTVLDEIVSPVLTNRWYRITVNEMRMVVVSDPDVIMEYSLEHLYSKNKVTYIKTLPMYGYSLTPNADVDFSSVQNTVYIKAVDDVKNISVILIYRTQMPAANALFDVIELPRRESVFQIQVCGFQVDFLNIITSDDFQLYRIFESPSLVIHNSIENFAFHISFKNSQSYYETNLISVEAIGIPKGFKPTVQFNKTFDGLQLQTNQTYSWNDRNWFKGHIIDYNFTCDDCQGVKTTQHITYVGKLPINSADYQQFSVQKGISVEENIFMYYKNGSIEKILNLPRLKLLENCKKLASFQEDKIIAACQQLSRRGINLYITPTTSFKAWTIGPYESKAFSAKKLQIEFNILMLADISTYAEYKIYKGSVFLYSTNFDKYSREEFNELQIIEEGDLVGIPGYTGKEVYLGDSFLSYIGKDTYRLYLTELDHGLFVLDFTYKVGNKNINVVKTTFLNLKELLLSNNLFLPNGAFFSSITMIKHNSEFKTENLLVTTKKYHNLELILTYDQWGNVIGTNLHRLYLRYSLYETIGVAKVAPGYVGIHYVLPPSAQTNYWKQIIAIYDTTDESQIEDGYSERYMLGAYTSNTTIGSVQFSFNRTYDEKSGKIGLIINNLFGLMQQFQISKNLTIQLSSNISTQNLTFIPYNELQSRQFSVPIVIKDTFLTAFSPIELMVFITILLFIAYVWRTKKRQAKDDIISSQERIKEKFVLSQFQSEDHEE